MEDLVAEVVVDLAAGVAEVEEDLVVEAAVAGEVADLVEEVAAVDLAEEEDLEVEAVVVVKDSGVGAAVEGMEAVVVADTITGTVVEEEEDSIIEMAVVLRKALRVATGKIRDRSLNDLIVVAIRFSNCIYH